MPFKLPEIFWGRRNARPSQPEPPINPEKLLAGLIRGETALLEELNMELGKSPSPDQVVVRKLMKVLSTVRKEKDEVLANIRRQKGRRG